MHMRRECMLWPLVVFTGHRPQGGGR